MTLTVRKSGARADRGKSIGLTGRSQGPAELYLTGSAG
jgi:hypothetical protein